MFQLPHMIAVFERKRCPFPGRKSISDDSACIICLFVFYGNYAAVKTVFHNCFTGCACQAAFPCNSADSLSCMAAVHFFVRNNFSHIIAGRDCAAIQVCNNTGGLMFGCHFSQIKAFLDTGAHGIAIKTQPADNAGSRTTGFDPARIVTLFYTCIIYGSCNSARIETDLPRYGDFSQIIAAAEHCAALLLRTGIHFPCNTGSPFHSLNCAFIITFGNQYFCFFITDTLYNSAHIIS